MTSSATSTAGFVGTLKSSPALGRQAPTAPAMDGENLPDEGFGAAFDAILQFSRELGGKSAPDNPVDMPADHWNGPDRKLAAWSPQTDNVDGSPAAGDLLLAGGALIPEGDLPGFTIAGAPDDETTPLPINEQDKTITDAEPLTAAGAIEAAVTATREVTATPVVTAEPAANTVPAATAKPETIAPTVVTNKPAVTANLATPEHVPNIAIAASAVGREALIERPAAERDARVVRGDAAATPPRSDPFEGLRNLVHAVDRPAPPASQAKPQAMPLNAPPALDKSEVKSVETPPADRFTVNSPAADRPGQPVSREAGPAPAVNLTVVEARQYPGIGPLQTSASAIVSAISGNEGWQAMLGGGATIPATPVNRSGAPLNTLTIQLRPAELGSVNAVLRLSGDQLVVELKVETIEAYRQLSESQNAIVKALKGQGYSIEQITIQQAAPDRPLPFQSAVAGQNNGQTSGEAAGQPGHDNPTQADGGRTGQDNSHDDGYENEGRGPEDLSGGNSSRTGVDGAVYL